MIAVRVRVEPMDGGGIPWRDRLTVLCGQLTLIRRQAEEGLPVPTESIARAERLARELEPIEESPQ